MTISYQIHPSIGIARIGNSPNYFLGPEYGNPNFPPRSFRDHEGRLLRQAARFRVFRVETTPGEIPKAYEINSKDAEIVWTVELANRKAVGRNLYDVNKGNTYRNGTDPSNPDPTLIIGPTKGEVSSKAWNKLHPPQFHPLVGHFRKRQKEIILGGIKVDDQGRLIVVGGTGESGYKDQSGKSKHSGGLNFADNDHWYDDTSDGIIRAEIHIKGEAKKRTATPAWVLVGPPDFAPEIQNLITLYDLAFQKAIDRGLRQAPEPPDFQRDIEPILRRALGYRWVNRHAAARHGAGHPYDFDLPFWEKLADPKQEIVVRDRLFSRLRDPDQNTDASKLSQTDMPRLHDDLRSSDVYDYKPVMPLLPFQYKMMKQWRDGKFTNNAPPGPPEPLTDKIDRYSMQSCIGGPFYPGMETWDIIREDHVWAGTKSDPFRLNVSNKAVPVDARTLVPGLLTEGNGVPWQSDFLACQWEDGAGWWPAQRPDHVRIDPDSTNMADWAGGIAPHSKRPVAKDMIEHWHQLGFVVRAVNSLDKEVFVESERDPKHELFAREPPEDD